MSTTRPKQPIPQDPVLRRLHFRSARVITSAALSFCLVAARAQAPAPGIALASVALPNAPIPASGVDAPSSNTTDVTVRNSLNIFFHDQGAIWTSPARLRTHDLRWLLPLAVAAGAAIATDHHTQSQVVSKNPSFNNDNVNVSDGLVGGLIAVPVVLFAKGQFGQDDHAREAGILGGEAMADGVVVEQALKLVFWRERPTVDSSRGHFFQSSAGPESSFPSAHATVAWAAASAVAGEYHSPWIQASVYTGATAVSLTRVLGRQHFPSDALVGAATGWLIGHYVVKKHHKIWMH